MKEEGFLYYSLQKQNCILFFHFVFQFFNLKCHRGTEFCFLKHFLHLK